MAFTYGWINKTSWKNHYGIDPSKIWNLLPDNKLEIQTFLDRAMYHTSLDLPDDTEGRGTGAIIDPRLSTRFIQESSSRYRKSVS